MFLLSKEPGDPTPPVGRMRPIQMYAPIRKALEGQLSLLDEKVMWAIIHPNQAGARPKSLIWI